ncbi:hypothetical protein [Pseudohoeflea coraliihabitans]|uniref:Uncharacterized protein n=1 Tax=Pseudohoeflea coraliihabitans TaxID=2860393 RepID=A0ABS6WLX6_9HYPH|nr:hypothetical protein [Pseudohoeflea sp. DP4N28-3]MBW3096120.1 hypothetical protein [Pseudohoeflea sp. DP4N28-3]
MRQKHPSPPLEGLRQQIRKTRATPSSKRDRSESTGFIRETYLLERQAARAKAREWFDSWPKAAYWTEVESWRELPDARIEFTMRRLPSAD